jgi:hypothetical protein
MKKKGKLPAAVELGRLGGLARLKKLTPQERSDIAKMGNFARNCNLSPEERTRLARLAAEARWGKK